MTRFTTVSAIITGQKFGPIPLGAMICGFVPLTCSLTRPPYWFPRRGALRAAGRSAFGASGGQSARQCVDGGDCGPADARARARGKGGGDLLGGRDPAFADGEGVQRRERAQEAERGQFAR